MKDPSGAHPELIEKISFLRQVETIHFFPVLFVIVVMLLVVCLTSGPCKAAGSEPEVRVGNELDFPPYAFVDKNGQPAGFSVELIKAVTNAMGLSVKISTGPWDTVWKALVAGQLDVLPIVAKLPERQRLVDFSLPHTETYDAFFVRDGDPLIQNIAAARGKEIVAMRSDAAHHELLKRNFQGSLVLVDTMPEGLKLVSSGKHNAFLCSKLIGTLLIKEHRLKNLVAGPIIPDYKRTFSFAVKKGDTELLEKLNQGLLIVKTNGEYDRIYAKWLTFDDPWRNVRKYLLPAAITMFAIALIAGFWLVMLQMLVRKRTHELAEKNKMLLHSYDDLEARVQERTAQLARSNQSLQSEITERKRVEETLRESENELQLLFKSMINAFVLFDSVFDDDGNFVSYRFVYINDAYERITGVKNDEVKGRTVHEVWPGTEPEWIKRYGEVAVTGVTSTFDMYHDPTKKFYHCNVYRPWKTKDRFCVIFEDITERRQALAELKESKALVEAIVENVPLMIFLKEATDLRFVIFNRAGEELLGYDRRDLIGKNNLDLFPPEQAAHFMEKDREVLDGEADMLDIPEEPILTARKGQRLLHTRKVCIRGPDGVTKFLLGISDDITERKQAEEALMESEERFRNLYNNAEVGLFRTRISDGVPLQINQRYAEMAGYETIEECLENFVAADHYADPEVRERMVEAITKHGEVKNYQAEIIRKDNKHFWIDFSARAYPEGGYVEGALVDITDKKNAERKLVASLIEKETLLKEIHHRVKNNLQVISSLLDLQSSYLKDEKAREVFRNSMDRISTMARVHTMLYQSEDMSRIDLGGFIGDLAVRLQQSHWITGSPVDIHVDVPDVSLTIETSIPCGLILNELVSNALKHAFPEGKGGDIHITMKAEGDQFVLTVSDNGTGFPSDADFRNTKTLGLELVNLLAGQMGGTIDMQVDAGTTWTITFPAAGKEG